MIEAKFKSIKKPPPNPRTRTKSWSFKTSSAACKPLTKMPINKIF